MERNQTNLGFVANSNRGAELATGKYILFLNSDTEVLPGWLDPAVELLESSPKIGVVGLKLVYPPMLIPQRTVVNVNGSSEVVTTQQEIVTIQSCGGLYDVNRMPYHRYLQWDASDPRVNVTEKVAWTTGAALLTKRELFNQVGGFDPEYGRGYFDDPDYCEAVKSLGYEVWYCPQSCVIHYVGQSMGAVTKTPEQKRLANKSFYQNARRFESKWHDKINPDVNYPMVNY